MYESGKMRSIETIPGMRGERVTENDRGVNATSTYRMNFCKCDNEPPV
jgi:hypothetical protein